jgi:iron complex outermembrane receptor protein
VTDFLLDTNGAGQLNAAFPSANVLQYETDAAGFGQINYDVLANLELTLALRYDKESRDQTDHLTGDKVSGSWSKPQPKVSLAYRWTPDLMLYGTYAVGFRSGGFNAPSPAYPLSYQPESVDSYELGFKSTLWDQRLRLEGALFYNKITDFQEFAFVGAYQGLFNLDKSHTDGGELQAAFKVSDGLRLDLGLGYTNSRIDEYRLKGAQFETAIPVVPAQIVGNSLPLVWRESESLGVEYTHLLPFDSGWSMTWRTDLSSRQDMYWQIDNLAEERPRTILDMSIRAYNDVWSVMAYAKDLNNRQYDEEYFEKNWCCATNIRYPNEPRRFGVTVKRSF